MSNSSIIPWKWPEISIFLTQFMQMAMLNLKNFSPAVDSKACFACRIFVVVKCFINWVPGSRNCDPKQNIVACSHCLKYNIFYHFTSETMLVKIATGVEITLGHRTWPILFATWLVINFPNFKLCLVILWK